MDDLLWPHFQPLWRDLVAVSSTNILVAGGYGLFLKQHWLSRSASLPTVVPIPNWLDTTPRVTKDVDSSVRNGKLATQQPFVECCQAGSVENRQYPSAFASRVFMLVVWLFS